MDGKQRVEEFLDLYRQLEDSLEDKYRHSKRHYSSVVFEFSRDYESAPVRDRLEICREIRNLLTHNANLGGQPIVEPSAPVVEALRQVLEFVRRPPLAIDFATRADRVMKADLGQRVLRLMEVMDKNGYSHIPVMKEGVLWGVFSAGTVFRYLLHSGGEGISQGTTIAELGRYVQVEQHPENYRFVDRDATYLEVRQLFEQVKGRNKRVSAVFLTEGGSPRQRLLGMLTPWDVMGDPE